METILTRETEWTLDDVALMNAQMEYEADIGSHGQPMSEATDVLADPLTPGGWEYQAYYTRDYAALELKAGPARLKRSLGEDSNIDDLVWGVRKVMKPTTVKEPHG